MKDVETLLEHSTRQNDDEMRSYSEKNWNLALWNNQKSFVSHPFYQQHLWRKLKGNHLKWDTRPWYWRTLFVTSFPFTYFVLFPIVVLCDIMSCSNDILFESPEKDKKEEEKSCCQKEGRHKAFLRGLIHTPISRIVIHHILESIFLVLVYLSTIDPLDVYNKADVQWYDVLMVVYVVLYLIGDIVELWRAGSRIFTSFWLIYNFLTSLLLMIGILTAGFAFYCWDNNLDKDDRATLPGHAPANVGTTIYAFTVPFVLCRPLRWFLFSKTLGTTIVCTIKVMVNVIQASLIYFIIFGANAAGLYCMFKPFRLRRKIALNETSYDTMATTDYQMAQPDLAIGYGWMGAMFWRLFDPGEPDYVFIRKCDEGERNEDGNCPEDIGNVSLEFSHFMGIVMWALFQAVTTIVLLNLLIAQMNSTYDRVWTQADTIWKYSKSFYQVKFLDSRTSMPPPFK